MVRRLSWIPAHWLTLVYIVALIAAALALVNCGGTTQVSGMFNPPMGTVRVTVSDPPKCKFPNGTFKRVFVSIRSVQVHVSTMATDGSSGWQELAPGLAQTPIQVDLLAIPNNGCTLASLGSASLGVGDYQQIRLLLVSNTPGANDPKPASNACGSQGFNCVQLDDDSFHQLDLSSQANTGLKIPPGQVVGGPIRVTEGSNIDLNIDFNTCASIVAMPGKRFRLRPTLTAGQVSTQASASLSGQIVDSATMMPINGKVIVAIEQPDSAGVDRIIMEAATDSNGNFTFCPLPMGMFDVVAVAIGSNNTAFGPTVVLNVMTGNALGKIPLVAENNMTPLGPATINGTVTASSGTTPNTMGASVDVHMSALRQITVPGGTTMRPITLPLQGASTQNVAMASGMMCPMGTNCADYKLIVPANPPRVGTFASGGTMFAPEVGDMPYVVEGRATAPMSGGTAICRPSTQMTDKDSADMPLKVTGGATIKAKQLDFTGCM